MYKRLIAKTLLVWVIVTSLIVTVVGAARETVRPTEAHDRWTPAEQTVPSWKLPPLDKGWHWQIADNQLNLEPARSGRVKVYDVDYEYTTAAEVAQLKSLGQYVVAYMDVGAWENYRPDAGQFPKSVIKCNSGWSGEKYLDSRPEALAQYKGIMEKRFDLAKSKGFDAVEGDYQNNIADDICGTYKGMTQAQKIQIQDAFNQWFIAAVHARGMAAVLKNAPEHAARYAKWPDAAHPHGYDAALVEQCWEFSECSGYAEFVKRGKPVWNAEYKGQQATICPKANALGLNTARFPLNLTGQVSWACR